jgi:hypothetical protein
MMSTPTTDTLTTALTSLALTLPALLSGGILSISGLAWPAITLAPTPTLLTQYVHIYAHGAAAAPPIALSAALSSSLLAYLSYSSGEGENASMKAGLWVAAAVSTMSIVPFTLVAMKEANGGLHEREEEVRKADGQVKGEKWEEETRELVKSWGRLNAVRGVLCAAGCGFGWWAFMS